MKLRLINTGVLTNSKGGDSNGSNIEKMGFCLHGIYESEGEAYLDAWGDMIYKFKEGETLRASRFEQVIEDDYELTF